MDDDDTRAVCCCCCCCCPFSYNNHFAVRSRRPTDDDYREKDDCDLWIVGKNKRRTTMNLEKNRCLSRPLVSRKWPPINQVGCDQSIIFGKKPRKPFQFNLNHSHQLWKTFTLSRGLRPFFVEDRTHNWLTPFRSQKTNQVMIYICSGKDHQICWENFNLQPSSGIIGKSSLAPKGNKAMSTFPEN